MTVSPIAPIRIRKTSELIEVRRGARGGPVVRRPSETPALRALTALLALGAQAPPGGRDGGPDARAAAALRAATAAMRGVAS